MRARRTVRRRRSTSALLVAYVTLAIVSIPAFAGADKPDDPGARGQGQTQGQGQGRGQGQGGPHSGPTPAATATTTPFDTPTGSSGATPAPPNDDPGQGEGPAGPAAGPTDATHPPGNNGTVKIDAQPWDDHPNNEPHVGCLFQLDLYGYDEGKGLAAEYLFELWPPTGSGDLVNGSVWIGEDPAGGGTDHDASVTIDIEDEVLSSGFGPHPLQGWHIRLTVHADGSIGADVKHKMFWVTCGAQPTQSSTPPDTSTPSVAPSTVTPTTPPTKTPPTKSPTVAPSTVRPPTPPPGNLPFTGSTLGMLATLAALFLLVGTAALRLSARAELRGTRGRG